MLSAWLLLIASLPTQNSAGRMRVWRALKGLGCGILRDGVYLLPNRPGLRHSLQAQADDVTAGGGSSHVLVFDSENQQQQAAFEALFNRSSEYAKLAEAIRHAGDEHRQSENAVSLQRAIIRLRKEFEAVAALDYFPGAAKQQTSAALEDLEQSADWSADEPHAVQGRIKRLNPKDYQGRLWATRQRPWIDRLTSAWLIQRFIDTQARFLWLASPADCPAEALGFDFDGADFTHVGAKVSFEVLVASFGLATDTALHRLGALVHYLDVGGLPVPEAAGLETLIRGMQQRFSDDDTLLAEACKVFDAFYLAFSGNEA
jgi:hypothetical protein